MKSTLKISSHINKLHQFDSERKAWLGLSVFVIAVIVGIVFGWNLVVQNHLLWLVVAGGLTISSVWWYWTMRVVRHLINSKHDEYVILQDIVDSIAEIKKDVKNL